MFDEKSNHYKRYFLFYRLILINFYYLAIIQSSKNEHDNDTIAR